MTRSADIAKAREIDTRIAAAFTEFHKVADQISSLQVSLASDTQTWNSVKGTRREISYSSFPAAIARAEARIAELTPEADRLYKIASDMDRDEYTGWSRFFLVEHIHSNRACSSFRPTTRIGWLPSVSGLTEAEAVKEHGATLCTICFPSAPVELTTKPVDESVCKGSGSFVRQDLPNRLGFYTGNWAQCPDCGQRITVRGQNGVKLMKHKK